jgi:hypothetical protein
LLIQFFQIFSINSIENIHLFLKMSQRQLQTIGGITIMFDETNLYKTKGHFFYTPSDSLVELCKDIPKKPGVFYILRLAKGRVDLVSIGRSQRIQSPQKSIIISLQKSILFFPDGKEREPFLQQKILQEKIDTLDIYWYVTMDKSNHHLPEYTEGILRQRYFEAIGNLPPWDEE